jgi:hypothetical protein
MKEIGKQYSNDDKTDPSGFLRRARLYQSKYRAETLKLDFDELGNYLIKADGEVGNNFYEDFGIFEAVKKYRKYNKQLYSNMLRSEHIPFNFFVPFRLNLDFCKNVFNEFLNSNIQTIDRIEIEYAPRPAAKYLNDRTSFDAYIEYTHIDKSKGIIGIEVKYTEREYPLIKYKKNKKTGKKEITKAWIDVENYKNQKSDSIYLSVTKRSKLFKEQYHLDLIKDDFRQIWRNHILGESILQADKDKFKHFTSLTLFPRDNEHFVETSKSYKNFLNYNDNKFISLMYEDFFTFLGNHCPDNRYKNWLEYLINRYIIK